MNDEMRKIIENAWKAAKIKAKSFAQADQIGSNDYMQDLAWLDGVYYALQCLDQITQEEEWEDYSKNSQEVIDLAWK